MNAHAEYPAVTAAGYHITLKLLPEVYEAVLDAAKEQRTTPETIIAEACRAYVLGDRG
jgi:2'-5' RNA ligase